MILRALVVGRLGSNCYLVGCDRTQESMVIDPGDDVEKILAAAEQARAVIKEIVLTHFHFDHILAAEALHTATGAPLAIHHLEAELLTNPPDLFRYFAPDVPEGLQADILLHDGDVVRVGDLEAEVLHTPGHSPGSVSLWIEEEGVIFAGDLLFRQGVGRTDFPGSSQAQLVQSVREKIFALPDDTIVYPGHGPETTVGYERENNPWVGERRR